MVVQAGAARQVLARRSRRGHQSAARGGIKRPDGHDRASSPARPAQPGRGRSGAAGPVRATAAGAARPADLAPQPGLGQLQRSLAGVTAAGLPVELKVGGIPRALPPGLDLAAYRVVQEALTNVLKHAGKPGTTSGSTTGTSRPGGRGRRRRAAHPAAAGPAVSTVPGSGRGLLGLRERIALYGGELDARPAPGWRLAGPGPAAGGPTGRSRCAAAPPASRSGRRGTVTGT